MTPFMKEITRMFGEEHCAPTGTHSARALATEGQLQRLKGRVPTLTIFLLSDGKDPWGRHLVSIEAQKPDQASLRSLQLDEEYPPSVTHKNTQRF